MANTKSAQKRMRQALKRRDRNRAHRSAMRTAIKNLRAAVAEGDNAKATELLPGTVAMVDSKVKHGIIHRNAAARTKSRLTRAVNGMASS